MPFKYTIEDAKKIFGLEGYTLTSDTYEGVRKYLDYVCPNGHKGSSPLFDFMQGTGKCYCLSSRKVWSGYNLLLSYPGVGDDWDYDLNFPLRPEDMTPGSGKKVWWKCDRCAVKHSYKQSISKHGRDGRRCPYYVGRSAGYGNDLYTNRKEMCDRDWDWGANGKRPNEYTTHAGAKVFWLCDKCKISHRYLARVVDKIRGRGCPYYSGKLVGFGNSVLDRHPDVSKDWAHSLNKKGPHEYTFGSRKKVWFSHTTFDGEVHTWKARIKNRTLGKTQCPHCVCGDVSKISQVWLDSLDIKYLLREYPIEIGNAKFRVDGFDLQTNTVYEFLGDYWHGNPEVFSCSKMNKRSGKTFGLLYKETFEKIEKLESVGYKVVYIWENDFNKEV